MGKSVRDKVLFANPVKGATPRAYETHPNPNSTGKQKARGTTVKASVKLGKIPNKNPKGFKL